ALVLTEGLEAYGRRQGEDGSFVQHRYIFRFRWPCGLACMRQSTMAHGREPLLLLPDGGDPLCSTCCLPPHGSSTFAPTRTSIIRRSWRRSKRAPPNSLLPALHTPAASPSRMPGQSVSLSTCLPPGASARLPFACLHP